MRWISVKELLDPNGEWKLLKTQIFDFLISGLTLFSEDENPLHPISVDNLQIKLDIHREWLRVEEGKVRQTILSIPNDRYFIFLVKKHHFSFDSFGWLRPPHTSLVPGHQVPNPTIENIKKKIHLMENDLARFLPNPWAKCYGSLHISDREVEIYRILNAWAKTDEIRKFLPRNHALSRGGNESFSGVREVSEEESPNQRREQREYQDDPLQKIARQYLRDNPNAKSKDVVRLPSVKRLFPMLSENTLKKRLQGYGLFKKGRRKSE